VYTIIQKSQNENLGL